MLRAHVAATQVPLRLSTVVWEAHPQRYNLTVTALGVLRLRPNAEAVYEDPLAFLPPGDDWAGRIARQNLACPHKPRADLVLLGHAYAPPGEEVERVVLRLTLGDYTKALSVTGDRLWRRDAGRWTATPPRRFAQLSLAPERALLSAENPVGIDPSSIPVEHRLAMPNLEPVGSAFHAVVGPVPPHAPSRAGLLAPHALAWATSFDPQIPPQRALARGPVAEGMNFAYFQVAPADQQLAEIPLGSALVLENAHPAHAVLTSRLPALAPRLTAIDPVTGARSTSMLRCDTLWIDGDRGTVDLVFRGLVELSRPDLLPHLSVELEPIQPAPQRESARLGTTQQTPLSSGARPGGLLTTQIAPLDPATASHRAPMASSPGLPFVSARGPHERAAATVGQPVSKPPSSHPPFAEEPTAELERGSYPPPPPPRQRAITAELELPSESSALPFGADTGAQAWEEHTPLDDDATIDRHDAEPSTVGAPARPTNPRTLAPPPSYGADLDEPTDVGQPGRRAEHAALPFASAPVSVTPRTLRATQRLTPATEPALPHSQPEPATLPRGRGDASQPHAAPDTSAAPASVTLVHRSAPRSGAAPSADAEDLPAQATQDAALVPKGEVGPVPALEATLPPPLPDEFDPEPIVETPPQAAPIQGPPVVIAAQPSPAPPPLMAPPPVPVPAADFVDEPTPPAEAPEPKGPPTAEPAGPRESLELEECAALRARLTQPGADRVEVLRGSRLDEAAFTRLEREHLKAIDEGAKSGQSELLDRYEDAYVAALDERSGPIDELAYARLQFAKESGSLAEALDSLGVARSELMRLERVWRRRMLRDRELAERVEDELERLRSA